MGLPSLATLAVLVWTFRRIFCRRKYGRLGRGFGWRVPVRNPEQYGLKGRWLYSRPTTPSPLRVRYGTRFRSTPANGLKATLADVVPEDGNTANRCAPALQGRTRCEYLVT